MLCDRPGCCSHPHHTPRRRRLQVFTLFMVLSLMFEIVTHRVRHFFLRRGRPGMGGRLRATTAAAPCHAPPAHALLLQRPTFLALHHRCASLELF